jgi:hypothetical protein
MFHANKRLFHSNGGLFRTIFNGITFFLYLFHGLIEDCTVFMPISIQIQAHSTFFTPKNRMIKVRGASDFVTFRTIFVPEVLHFIPPGTKRECCLLVLNLVSSTLPCIRRPRPRLHKCFEPIWRL